MDLVLFVLRIVVGLLFVGHGTQKLFGFFGGGGLEGTAGFFEQLGLRPGRLHAVLAGCAEAGGGLLLALGLVVPVGAAAVIAVMATAVITVHARNGIWVSANGVEYTLVMAAAAFALAGVGAGSWSLDEALGIHLASAGWAIGAVAVGLLGAIAAVIGGRAYRRRGAGEGQQPRMT
jgi:putative oxidoreductase